MDLNGFTEIYFNEIWTLECSASKCFKVLFDLSLKNLTKNSLMFFIEQNSKKKVFYFTHADLH